MKFVAVSLLVKDLNCIGRNGLRNRSALVGYTILLVDSSSSSSSSSMEDDGAKLVAGTQASI
jgi:hypothetical protein